MVTYMYMPSVFEHRRTLIQDPTSSVDKKPCFIMCQERICTLHHAQAVETKKDHELSDFDDVTRPGNNEPVLVEKWRFSRIVKRDWLVLVMIRNNVKKGSWRIDNSAAIDSVYDFLRC